MEIEKKETVKFALYLERKEAEILKSMCQNPILKDEPMEIEEFRLNLFTQLKKELENENLQKPL